MIPIASIILGKGAAASDVPQARTIPKFAVVDPMHVYESDFVDAIKAREFECVKVRSDAKFLPKIKGHAHKPTEECEYALDYDPDIGITVAKLRELEVTHIIPGCEEAVPYTDRLVQAYGALGNDPKLSLHRRDKFLMREALAAAEVRIPKYRSVASFDEAKAFIKESTLSYPVVAKPRKSGASDNVFICQSEGELEHAFSSILGTQTIFAELNAQVLVEEFVDGEEYIVNLISQNGSHYVSDIWKYTKGLHNGSSIVYERTDLLFPNDPCYTMLSQYAKTCLDALGYRYSAAHLEAKINSKGEPVIIEVGARVSGLSLHKVVRECRDDQANQLTLLLDAYLDDSTTFSTRISTGTYVKSATVVSLISHHNGPPKNFALVSTIRELSSFQFFIKEVYPDVVYPLTIDFLTSPGAIALIHKNFHQIEKDYNALRTIEKKIF